MYYPYMDITIVLFYYNRKNVEALLKNINQQKNSIKSHGITVGGRNIKVKFTGIEFDLLIFTNI